MARSIRHCLTIVALFGLCAGCKVAVSTSSADDAKPDPDASQGTVKPGAGDDGGEGEDTEDPDRLTTPPGEEGGEQANPSGTIKAAGAKKCEDPEHAIGDSWKDDCNTCSCNEDGKVVCTRMACNVPDKSAPH